jgi:hypothetical protein
MTHGLAHVLAHARWDDSMTRTTWGDIGGCQWRRAGVVFQANGNDTPESFLKSDTYFLHTAKPVISVC